MKLGVLCIAFFVVASAQADVYNNGAITEAVNSAGNAVSILQPSDGGMGIDITTHSNRWAADDFTVTGAGWRVSELSFYAYVENASSTSFTFRNASVTIAQGDNPNAGFNVFQKTSALVTHGGFIGYRVAANNLLDTTRPIFKITLSTGVLILPASRYSLRWSIEAQPGQTVWQVPVVPFNYSGGSGSESIDGSHFMPALDPISGRRFEFPFQVWLPFIPEPGSITALGVGALLIVRKARQRS